MMRTGKAIAAEKEKEMFRWSRILVETTYQQSV